MTDPDPRFLACLIRLRLLAITDRMANAAIERATT